jgi:DHA2 family multidrug resistance protein
MFCILPPTRLALGLLAPAQVPDASGLFNLMRNLGGAIGIALIDTVIYSRAPIHAQAIANHLQKGDVETAKAVGIPLERFLAQPLDIGIQPMVERLALVQSINEAWFMVASLTIVALLCVPFARFQRRAIDDA